MNTAPPAGIYVHVPFCIRKCAYCDFYSITDLSSVPDYVRAVHTEMALSEGKGMKSDTLYIGGGTPSVVDVDGIRSIIEAAAASFQMAASAEVTIEVNPGASTRDRLAGYYRSGANRMMVGVQSFQDENLKVLGRIHTARDAETALDRAYSAGFSNIGLDLIYGIPGQTVEKWLEDLKRALIFAPAHISCYMLSYEPGTPMHRLMKNGRIQPLSEGRLAEMFETTRAFLVDHGYAQYEISNFARVDPTSSGDYRSRHNRKYWSFAPYIGLGPSAHSFLEPFRYWNCRSVSTYIREISAGRRPIQSQETLGPEQLMIEAIYLGLRQTEGIDTARFDEKLGVRFRALFKHTLAHLHDTGSVTLTRDHCALTPKGMRFLDHIAALFVSRELEE